MKGKRICIYIWVRDCHHYSICPTSPTKVRHKLHGRATDFPVFISVINFEKL